MGGVAKKSRGAAAPPLRNAVARAGGALGPSLAVRPGGRVAAPGVSQDQMKAMAQEKIRRWKKAWPCTWSVPNVGQARLLKYLEKRPYPKDLIFLAGNGVGKSHLGVKIMAGIVWGPKAVSSGGMHHDWDGERHYEAWRSFRERAQRENRPIAGRIIAASDSLKGNGPMIQRVERLFPKGLWKGEKNGNKYVSEIYCWDSVEERREGNREKCIAIIDVKTHMQDPDQHRGADLDFILLDEPVPPDVYEECVGRTRANPDAVRIFTITPLEMSGWLIDTLVEGADGIKVAVAYGSLWDNCKDWHPHDEMWSSGKVGEGHVITRGVLERISIDDMIDKWTRMSPDTVAARVWGKATHLAGSVYKSWNPLVHMVDEILEPWEDWPIWCITDPHHARPPATIWVAQGPHTSYVIAEYPDEEYTKMSGAFIVDGVKRVTIEDHGRAFKFWERLMGVRENDEEEPDRIPHRWGDPNSLHYTYSTSSAGEDGMNLQGLLYNVGLWFECANDNIKTGHEFVSMLLHYNPDQPVVFPNVPRLRVLKTNLATGQPMVNVPNAMARYGFKKKALENNVQPSGNPRSVMDERYKDFADCVRYFAVEMVNEPFQPVNKRRNLVDVIRESRARVHQHVAEER